MRRFLLLCSLLLIAHPVVLSGDDWPNFRGPNRDGKSESTEINASWTKSKPALLLEIQGAGHGYASLCVGDGKIFTTGNGDNSQFAVCFDQKTGALHWRKELVNVRPNHSVVGSRSTPAYSENRLYVTSSDGQLFCLDTENDGKIVWQKSFQKDFGGRLMSNYGYAESPMVDGDQVVVTPGGEDALLVALRKEDGKVIWKSKLDETRSDFNQSKIQLRDGAGFSSMVKLENGENSQYVQFVGRGLVGIHCKTGTVLWKHSKSASRTSNICSPVVDGKSVAYSAAPKGGLSILNLTEDLQFKKIKIEEVFGDRKPVCHHGGMVVHDGHLFFGSGENRGYPTCMEMSTGKIKWGGAFRGPGRGSASVVYVDGRVIFRYQNGVVAMFLASAEQYQPLGHFTQSVKSENESWAHPVVVNKQLLLRERDKIMVYDLK